MTYSFHDFIPVIHPSAFVHPQACITGNVIIGQDCYVGPGAALRGDWGGIILEDGCNVQENCTLHMFPGLTTLLRSGAHIGHGAIIHGAEIGRNCLVGMNSVIMDHVLVGDESIIGALSFVQEGLKIEPRSLYAGNPAKFIKAVSDEMITWKSKGTALYRQLPEEMRLHWQPCAPLEKPESNRPQQEQLYASWQKIKQGK